MERYFFRMMNCKESNMIYLPIEIQEIILEYLFPLCYMNCSRCKRIILYKDKNNCLLSRENYSIIKGKLICVNCEIDNINFKH